MEQRKPDIMICNTRSIIGVVELKYNPMGSPKYLKDMETLDWIARNPDGVQVQNNRYVGVVRDDRVYPLASEAVLCWAGIHR